MAGEVITTGTRAADAARTDAERGTARDAEQAEAAVTAGVPDPRALNGTPETPQASTSETSQAAPAPSSARPSTRPSAAAARTARGAGTGTARGQAADGAAPGVGVRRRLARLGAQRGAGINPVLEPLIKTVRGTHPKADIRLIERAYESAAYWHRDQKRRSGDPYITHPLAVATILAELGMNTETICAALLHDTVEDTPYTPDRTARRVRRGHRRAGGRRHQAGQGQVRRVGRGGNRPQDGGRDVPRHPRAGHQARRPAA